MPSCSQKSAVNRPAVRASDPSSLTPLGFKGVSLQGQPSRFRGCDQLVLCGGEGGKRTARYAQPVLFSFSDGCEIPERRTAYSETWPLVRRSTARRGREAVLSCFLCGASLAGDRLDENV